MTFTGEKDKPTLIRWGAPLVSVYVTTFPGQKGDEESLQIKSEGRRGEKAGTKQPRCAQEKKKEKKAVGKTETPPLVGRRKEEGRT